MKNDMMIKTLIGAVIVAVVIITIINYNKREQMLEDIKAYVEANDVNLKKIAEAKIKAGKLCDGISADIQKIIDSVK